MGAPLVLHRAFRGFLPRPHVHQTTASIYSKPNMFRISRAVNKIVIRNSGRAARPSACLPNKGFLPRHRVHLFEIEYSRSGQEDSHTRQEVTRDVPEQSMRQSYTIAGAPLVLQRVFRGFLPRPHVHRNTASIYSKLNILEFPRAVNKTVIRDSGRAARPSTRLPRFPAPPPRLSKICVHLFEIKYSRMF